MTVHRADCEDCPWSFEDEDFVEVTDRLERHERKEQHNVMFERDAGAVATDGGVDVDGPGERVSCYVLEFDDGHYHTFGHHYPEFAEEIDDATLTIAWWDVTDAPGDQEDPDPASGVRLAVDMDRIDPDDDLQYLVSLAVDARRYDGHWDGDSTAAAKWAVAQWCQEIGWAPNLQDLEPGEMVPKDDLPDSLAAAFDPPADIVTDGGHCAGGTEQDVKQTSHRKKRSGHAEHEIEGPYVSRDFLAATPVSQGFCIKYFGMDISITNYFSVGRALKAKQADRLVNTRTDQGDPVTDGGRKSIGDLEAADVLDVDGHAVLALQGTEETVGVHVPEDKAAPLTATVQAIDDVYDDESSKQVATDGGPDAADEARCDICDTEFDSVEDLREHDCGDAGQTVFVGDHVDDRENDDRPTMVVTGLPVGRASEYSVTNDATVADYNDDYPADDHVVEATYPQRTDKALDTDNVYAFPRSRLDLVASIHDVTDDEGGEDA